ncbi:exo-beta-N-acetylmuramidase NamZ domain-containing protein [Thermodesulfobacteriota bacterium]
MTTQIKTGLEQLAENPLKWMFGKRLGLLSNPASVDSKLYHARIILDRLFPGQLTALYSPQHGFFAEKQDNMIESDHMRDSILDIPIFSLYGETRIPTEKMLDPVDILVVDLQDAGTRVYTFIYTMSYCLEAARRFNKKVVVLDRPNPINGLMCEGNVLSPECASFVGRYRIPMRHGLTIGELARLFNDYFGIGCDLEVIPMKGWRRKMYFHDTGLVWVPPSPNLPTPASAIVYPGQVIWEGTNISEGRGTTQPFELFGAPFLDTKKILLSMGGNRFPGVTLRQTVFEPTSNKWARKFCKGFQIHVTDLYEYMPYAFTLKLLQTIMYYHPGHFEWKSPPYEYEYDRFPIDLIIGDKNIRERIESHDGIDEIEASWKDDLAAFQSLSHRFYLYS